MSKKGQKRRHHSPRDSSSSEDHNKDKYSKKSRSSTREQEDRGSRTRREQNSPDLMRSLQDYDDFDVASRNFNPENPEVTQHIKRNRKRGEKRRTSPRNSGESSDEQNRRMKAAKRRSSSESSSRGKRSKRRETSSVSHRNEHSRRKERRRNSSSDEEFLRRKEQRRHKRNSSRDRNGKACEKDSSTIKPSEKRTVDLLTSKTGGAYIPPAKLRQMQAEITDKSSEAYQRIAWEALKKSIHGHINKVNTSNIGLITRELLKENIVRGRGLLSRSIIQAQAASPTFTPVYAALTAVINSKFPKIGELLLKRLVNQFKRGFKRNDKPLCISSGTFMSHLVNQNVAHEILVLQLLTLLVENPTDDSIEVAIAVLKECGMRLMEVSKVAIEGVFSALRNTLHKGQLDKRVQYMIEVMFQVRKDGFKDHEAIPDELDLIKEEDQLTHLITLDEPHDSQDILNVFKFDAEFQANEEKYKTLSKEILDTDSSSDGNDSSDDDEDDDEENSDEEAEEKKAVIIDNTGTNREGLRRTIYLTIQSSLHFEECAHKLIKMQLKPGEEIELCNMFLDCCAEMRTYDKFYGLLSGRFCTINKIYVMHFEQIFKDSYDTIHRLDMNKMRNIAKLFAHLLFTDSISWQVLDCIKLNEDDTTSSGRVFIKFLFQELAEYMGLEKLNARVKDVTLQEAFAGLFPRDNPRDTRFAINFFTLIGLGGLTDDLREHLKNKPKPVPLPPPVIKSESSSDSSSESSDSSSESSSESSSTDSSSSSTSSSEDERSKRKKKKTRKGRSDDRQRSTGLKKSDKKEKSSSKKNRKKKKSRK